MINDIIDKINTTKYKRGYCKNVVLQIIADNKQSDIANITLNDTASSIYQGYPLTGICVRLGNRIIRTMSLQLPDNDSFIIKLGATALDWLAQCNLVKVKKYATIDTNGRDQYFLQPINEYKEYSNNNGVDKLRANIGHQEWTKPILYVNDYKIDIVKRAKKHNLLHHYRYSNMPDVYNALNKLGRTEWSINTKLLDYLKTNNELIPQPISENERLIANQALTNISRTKVWYRDEIRYKHYINQGIEEDTAEIYAKRDAEDFEKRKSFDHKVIISKWSKRMEYDKIIELAESYLGSTLNFIYNCDSRGRIYAIQSYLNPQGNDIAKALLVFKNPKPISTYDFYITIANHAGQDKVSWDDRIQWVKDNHNNILEVGTNPNSELSNAWLVSSKIANEKKSKFQFIASAIEYANLIDWIHQGNNQDDFLCSIPIAYDATNSGLQILSAIGRDEVVAPLVNITNTPKPGDVYQFIGDFVAKQHSVEPLKPIPPGDKLWRKICKRNVMTKCYAATQRGMGDQQWEDRKDHGSPITDNLTYKECNELGTVTYNVCNEKLLKASELMRTMKKSIRTITESVVKWRLPNGFTAFQVKDKSTMTSTRVEIGDSGVISLAYYKFTNIPNKQKHSNAISPDIVHSLDAWLLTLIVNGLPNDANLAFVHDQFGSDSCYGENIQSVAKAAYYTIVDRTVIKELLSSIANKEIELPEPGTWNTNEILTAEYIVS